MTSKPTILTSSFQHAIQNFKTKSGLGFKELTDMQVTSLPDLQKALAVMQQRQQSSRTMRALKRLQPFLDAMEQYSKVINVFANTSDFVAFIWGPMKFLLVIASNFAEAFNFLLDGYLTIGESLPQFSQYQDLFTKSSRMQAALALVFEDVLDFHLEAVKLFKQRTWKQLYHATWRGINTRIEHLAKSLQRHRRIVETQASIEEYESSQEFRKQMRSDLARVLASERDRRQNRVQQWLAPVNNDARHENAATKRFRDTGKWLLQEHRFQSWFSPDQCVDPLLWMHGNPGAGKTVLASLVVDKASKVPNTTTICFYCKIADEQRNGFLIVAKSLLSQLVLKEDPLLDYVYEKVSTSNKAMLSTIELAKELLGVALNSCRMVYVVLDGLDEYSRDDRKETALWFQEQISSLPRDAFGSVRCLFVSQEDGSARKDLSSLSQIKIEPKNNRDDIQAFCTEWHKRIESKFGTLEGEYDVKRIVSAKAQGMFLYARLVTWNLHEQSTRADFEAEMAERLPKGVDQAYERILARVRSRSPRPWSNTQKLLGWLACAKRPLKWYEIQGAVAVDLAQGVFSDKLKFREDSKDLCASLVEVNSDQTVTLVHATTREYLVRNEHIRTIDIEYDLAIRCCLYLSMPEFDTSCPSSEIEKAVWRGRYAFADYAACFWALHLETALAGLTEQDSDRLDELAERTGVFLETHLDAADTMYPISNTLSQHLSRLRQYDFFEGACQAVAAAKSWLRPSAKTPSSRDVLRLPVVMTQIRAVLERLVEAPSTMKESIDLMQEQYGPYFFKCTRMNCKFFHQGLQTDSQRRDHTDRHERSFTCLESGCPYSIIGFTTSKGLEKHALEFHGISMAEPEVGFPEDSPPKKPRPPTPTQPQPRLPKPPPVYKCHLCNKTYTRAYNLKSHTRTHTNDRPFGCRYCGKWFARQHDCKRHEDLHKGEKRFVCGGELRASPGSRWGCGRRFGRADALKIHLGSEAGRLCIKPLQDEEAGESRKDPSLARETTTSSHLDLILNQDDAGVHPILSDTTEDEFQDDVREEVIDQLPGFRGQGSSPIAIDSD